MNATDTLASVLDDLARSADAGAARTIETNLARTQQLFQLADSLRSAARDYRAGTLSKHEARAAISTARITLLPDAQPTQEGHRR